MSGVVIVSAGSTYSSPPTTDAILVSGGGTVEDTTVMGSGNIDLLGPGAESLRISAIDGGYEGIHFGAASYSATIGGGGQQQISGIAYSTTVTTSGDQEVLNSGIASAAMLIGGIQGVGSGGFAFDTTVTSSGVELLFAGGSATGTVVSSGGTLWMLGGSAVALVENGGTEIVGASSSFFSGSAFVEFAQIESGGALVISSGATAENSIVSSGATEYVLTGGTEIVTSRILVGDGALIVSFGGQLIVSASGIASNAQLFGLASVTQGALVSAQVSSGGQLQVLSGGEAFATTLLDRSFAFVGADGAATSTVISSGGQLELSSGGRGSNTVVLSGGTEIVSAGAKEFLTNRNYVIVGDSDDVGATILGSGGQEDISSGGLGYGIDVHSSGALFVFSDGRANETQAESGGEVQVSAGGSAFGTLLNGGEEFAFAGGTVISAKVSGGAALWVSGGTASAATVFSGGSVVVSSGGLAFQTLLSSGGELEVSSGGTASDTVVMTGGTEVVSAGGQERLDIADFGELGGFVNAGSIILGSGGRMTITGAGFGSGIEVHSSGALFLLSGGLAHAALVESSGQVQVSGGGVARDTQLNGGFQFVDAGGQAFSSVVRSSGAELVNAGGFSSAANLGSLSVEQVSGLAAIAKGVVASGGGLVLVLGLGATDNTEVFSGGVEVVSALGVAVSTVVSAGGEQHLSSGGVASDTVVSSAGSEFIFSGGDGVSITVADGGAAFVSSGGTLDSPVVSAGGAVFAGGTITGPIRDDGLIVVSGELDVTAGLTGKGTLEIAAGATVIEDAKTTIGDIVVDGGGTLNVNGVTVITDPTTIDPGGTLTGTGTLEGALTNNGAIMVLSGSLDLAGAITGAGTLTIGGGGTLRLDGAVASGTTIAFASGSTATLQLSDPTADHAKIVGETSSDKVVDVPCLAAGTRIRTRAGDVLVEALRPGDLVTTWRAGFAPVVWTGHRRTDCRRHPRPWDVWPVRIAASAVGAGQPVRDVWLSPDHALWLAGALIPVRHLVNGRTIVQEPRDAIDYWHVELARHDVLLADGLACESFLDTGNRSAFAGAEAIQLHPDFAPRVWEADACAPLVLSGPRLDAAKRRLLRRAVALGNAVDSDLAGRARQRPARR